MSVERAVKFCKLCQFYNDKAGKTALYYSSRDNNPQIFQLRDNATSQALNALEGALNQINSDTGDGLSLTSATKNAGGDVAYYRYHAVNKIGQAITACMECDYSKASIVDVFIQKKDPVEVPKKRHNPPITEEDRKALQIPPIIG